MLVRRKNGIDSSGTEYFFSSGKIWIETSMKKLKAVVIEEKYSEC